MQTLYVKYLSPACLDSLSCDQLPEWNHKYERKHKADIKYIMNKFILPCKLCLLISPGRTTTSQGHSIVLV